MLKKFNSKLYNVLDKKNILDRIKYRIKREGSFIKELSNTSINIIQLYHYNDIDHNIEYYNFCIIPNVNKETYHIYHNIYGIGIYEVSELVKNNKKLLYYSIDITFNHNENVLCIKTYKDVTRRLTLCNFGFHCHKIMDNKDLDYIKSINVLFFNNKDDIINSLIQRVITYN